MYYHRHVITRYTQTQQVITCHNCLVTQFLLQLLVIGGSVYGNGIYYTQMSRISVVKTTLVIWQTGHS